MPIKFSTPPWRTDANYFSRLTQGEGWAFAAAVACAVQPDLGHGKRSERNVFGKVSATQFAKAAGTTTTQVMRYLRIWEKAAEEGYVPRAADLTPGSSESVALPTGLSWHEARRFVKEVASEEEMPLARVTTMRTTSAPVTTTSSEPNKSHTKPSVVEADPAAVRRSLLREPAKYAATQFARPDFSLEDREEMVEFGNRLVAVGKRIAGKARQGKPRSPPSPMMPPDRRSARGGLGWLLQRQVHRSIVGLPQECPPRPKDSLEFGVMRRVCVRADRPPDPQLTRR